MNENIKQMRLERLMTQREFAEWLGVSYRAVQNWEQGVCVPSLRMWRKILNKVKEGGSGKNDK